MSGGDLISTLGNLIAQKGANIGLAIVAIALAASGLVDATKAFFGGVNNVGIRTIENGLRPFKDALVHFDSNWFLNIRANWLNGVSKEDQKVAAKSLIRLGLSSTNVTQMAQAGRVDADALRKAFLALESGIPLSPIDERVLSRFYGAVDAAVDRCIELADSQYRNVSKAMAGFFAIAFAIFGGWYLHQAQGSHGGRHFLSDDYPLSVDYGEALIIGIVAVPLAPIVRDLLSSLRDLVMSLGSRKP